MSRGITLTVLSGLVLTACLTTGGCRRGPDYAWYDADGNRIAENWKTDATGKRVPDPHPRDRYGNLWVYNAAGELVPPAPPAGSRWRSGGGWFWGGSGYRSGGSSTSYRSGSSGSSVSRGGFGSTGMSGGG